MSMPGRCGVRVMTCRRNSSRRSPTRSGASWSRSTRRCNTYVRWKLNEKYGDAVQAKTGPIRSDLLGNMWAQEWGNIYDLVAPKGAGDVGYDTASCSRPRDTTRSRW